MKTRYTLLLGSLILSNTTGCGGTFRSINDSLNLGILGPRRAETFAPMPSPQATPTPAPQPSATTSTTTSAIKSISIEPDSYTIRIGTTDYINAIFVTLSDDQLGQIENRQHVTFTPADTNIATVDENGVILGKAVGKTLVTVTYGGVSTTAFVTITGDNL